jgi:hypothetical protein
LPSEADKLLLVGGPTANAREAARELTEVDVAELDGTTWGAQHNYFGTGSAGVSRRPRAWS